MSRLQRRSWGPAAVPALFAALGLTACGGAATHKAATTTARAPTPNTAAAASTTATSVPKPKPPPPAYPRLLPAATQSGVTPFVPAMTWRGRTAVWIARTPTGVTLLSFDQRLVALHLHSGSTNAGTLGWRSGPSIAGAERRGLVAAFNGAFRLSTGAGGFVSYGRIGAPLHNGLASVVTSSDGTTDIGSWHQEVPPPGKRVVSVRQNLNLLIDHGMAASNVDCVSCWGATLGGVVDPARGALGITGSGRLVWVAGERLTVSQLANALLDAHVVRAAELDINPEWVAGYLYGHRGGKGPLAPVAALPNQHGIPGQFLAPWTRDFFTVVVR